MNEDIIEALEWALLPPEDWDTYPEEKAIEHKKVLQLILDELRKGTSLRFFTKPLIIGIDPAKED